jgi:transcriptional regulator with XRE-family HTH domain
LAECLGLSAGVVSDWKSEKSASFKKYLPQIAKFLGVSVDYPVGNHPDDLTPEMRDILEELRSNPDLRRLFSTAKKATDEELRQAIAVIKALREIKQGGG